MTQKYRLVLVFHKRNNKNYYLCHGIVVSCAVIIAECHGIVVSFTVIIAVIYHKQVLIFNLTAWP